MTAQLVDQPEEPAQILTSDLLLILHNARLFTDNGHLIPIINSVNLESTGTHLVATGTDRFYMGSAAAPYSDEKWNVVLPNEHVDLLISMLRASVRRGTWKTAYLSRSPEGMRFKVAIPIDDLKLSFPTRKREDHSVLFPAWRSLVKENKVTPESPSQFMVDAARLARFAKVKTLPYAERYMRVSVPKANKAIQVRIGESFVGLIMPVRDTATTVSEEPKWV